MRKSHREILIAIFCLFSSGPAAAGESTSSLQVTRGRQPGTFFGGFEFASLQTSTQSLSGYGIQVGYRYVLTHRWAVDASLAQIYGSGSGSGLSALYSALNASVRYAPFAEFSQEKMAVLFEGKKFFEESSENNKTLAVGVQMNQLLLNGTSSVYNATGLGLVLSYDFRLWGYRVRPEARYGMLSANNSDMTAIFFNFLFAF